MLVCVCGQQAGKEFPDRSNSRTNEDMLASNSNIISNGPSMNKQATIKEAMKEEKGRKIKLLNGLVGLCEFSLNL